MKYGVLAVAAVLSVAIAAPARAQEHAARAGRHVVITGTVVDVSCLVGSGAQGENHRACAQTCADGGLPLAILGPHNRAYVPLAPAPGQGQNARLKEFAEHRVRVTGTVFEAHGINGIKIDSVTVAS